MTKISHALLGRAVSLITRWMAPNRLAQAAGLLGVGLILWLFLQRVVYPDLAFDTINYHFFLGKAGLENFPRPFGPGEFFPLGMHSFNPLADMLNVAAYEGLGYRLGTLLSAVFAAGAVVLCVALTLRCAGDRLGYAAVLVLVPMLVVNEGLFQLATYFTDNFFSFLALLGTWTLLRMQSQDSLRALSVGALVFGLTIGLLATKLTNMVYVLPLGAAACWVAWTARTRLQPAERGRFTLVVALAVAILVLIPGYHFVHAVRLTGNPVFPYYNAIFKSPFFPPESWPFNFGPVGWLQRLFYPYFVLKNPYLLGEVKDFFPDLKMFTLLFGLLIAAALAAWRRVRLSREEWLLLGVTGGSYLLWQFFFGYSRYGIGLEFLLGVALVVLLNRLFQEPALLGRLLGCVLAAGLLVVLDGHVRAIITFNTLHDLAWRPKVDFKEWRARIAHPDLLRSHTRYDPALGRRLAAVDVVVQCVNPSSAYARTLPDLAGKPMMNFDKGSNGGHTNSPAYIRARDEAAQAALRGAGKNVAQSGAIRFAIVLNETSEGGQSRQRCMDALAQEEASGRRLHLQESTSIDNFVGDERIRLAVFFGYYEPMRAGIGNSNL